MASHNEGRRRQRLYREVNKRIGDVAAAFPADGPIDFLCECGDQGCTVTIELTRVQWDSVFCEPESMLLAVEHNGAADGRRRIAENGRFILAATA